MSNTIIETQARHQINERLARASAPRMPPRSRRTGSPSAAPGRRPHRR